MVGLDNPFHIALLLVVVLMVFGAKRLPEMGKGLGEGMRGFKNGLSGDSDKHHEPQASLTKATETPVEEHSTATAPEREPVA